MFSPNLPKVVDKRKFNLELSFHDHYKLTLCWLILQEIYGKKVTRICIVHRGYYMACRDFLFLSGKNMCLFVK